MNLRHGSGLRESSGKHASSLLFPAPASQPDRATTTATLSGRRQGVPGCEPCLLPTTRTWRQRGVGHREPEKTGWSRDSNPKPTVGRDVGVPAPAGLK
ncbi:hypothetical protein FRUB_07624 [Fimbriiglobus ruber]|uniref:Uncharacterized protein n=1 Tax=Fimbriiglobus ruber TaxID=1908690 RepID=A0A225DFT8_9BACT|nr:hypothetical protein FRUB_07624 [Fimbriiglobus ruber]